MIRNLLDDTQAFVVNIDKLTYASLGRRIWRVRRVRRRRLGKQAFAAADRSLSFATTAIDGNQRYNLGAEVNSLVNRKNNRSIEPPEPC